MYVVCVSSVEPRCVGEGEGKGGGGARNDTPGFKASVYGVLS